MEWLCASEVAGAEWLCGLLWAAPGLLWTALGLLGAQPAEADVPKGRLPAYSFVRHWTTQPASAEPAAADVPKGRLPAYSFVRHWTTQLLGVQPTDAEVPMGCLPGVKSKLTTSEPVTAR